MIVARPYSPTALTQHLDLLRVDLDEVEVPGESSVYSDSILVGDRVQCTIDVWVDIDSTEPVLGVILETSDDAVSWTPTVGALFLETGPQYERIRVVGLDAYVRMQSTMNFTGTARVRYSLTFK